MATMAENSIAQLPREQRGVEMKIDPQLKALIPASTDEEREQLRLNVIEFGCLDPLRVWEEQGILIDGHTRYEICTEYDIPFEQEYLSFDDREQVIDWMINNQLGRRNLTKKQASHLRGIQYNREKKKQGAPEGNANASKQMGQNDPFESSQQSTAQKLATRHGVSPKTIKRDAEFAESIDTIAEVAGDDLKQDILTQKVRVSDFEVQELAEIAKEEPEKLQEAAAEIAKGKPAQEVVKSIVNPSRQGVKNGGKDEHNTPQDVITLAVEVLGEIDLDPFSDGHNVPAKRHITIEENGLKAPWSGEKLWMNPPFSDVGLCAERWIDYFSEGGGVEGIALTKLDSRPKWFEAMMNACDAIGLHRGYMTFGESTASAPFAVAYFYFGPYADVFCTVFSQIAWCFPTPEKNDSEGVGV